MVLPICLCPISGLLVLLGSGSQYLSFFKDRNFACWLDSNSGSSCLNAGITGAYHHTSFVMVRVKLATCHTSELPGKSLDKSEQTWDCLDQWSADMSEG